MLLYRVLPYQRGARDREPGGALYIPQQGGGRLDNPALYSVLYLSDAASGAIAESFGRFPEWTPAVLRGSPMLPGSVRALARYHLADDAAICNLDDPKKLLELQMRPSEAVTRDYTRSRAWARQIFEQNKWAGVRWWSYYDPRWASIGLWTTKGLRLEEVRPLKLDDPELIAASQTIVRRILEKPR